MGFLFQQEYQVERLDTQEKEKDSFLSYQLANHLWS